MLRPLALPWSPLSLLRLIAPRGARVGTHVGKLSVDCVGITESAHHGRQRVARRFTHSPRLELYLRCKYVTPYDYLIALRRNP
jgi:hypothetical protein